jgi:5-(carboxyamino)imidazole ribonucleotide mutase
LRRQKLVILRSFAALFLNLAQVLRTAASLAEIAEMARVRASPVPSSPEIAEKKPIALVGVIMGSSSDWDTLRHAAETLAALGVPHEVKVVSAHRTPDLMFDYAASAEARGLEVIIAGAGGAAHLPGMVAAKSVLPVLGVPVQSQALSGMDSLLSIAQMPAGIPVGTLAIGKAGAINAALLATAIVAGQRPELRKALHAYRQARTQAVLDNPDPRD